LNPEGPKIEARRTEARGPKGREREWGSWGGGSEPLPTSYGIMIMGERCKLSQRGQGRSPGRKRIFDVEDPIGLLVSYYGFSYGTGSVAYIKARLMMLGLFKYMHKNYITHVFVSLIPSLDHLWLDGEMGTTLKINLLIYCVSPYPMYVLPCGQPNQSQPTPSS